MRTTNIITKMACIAWAAVAVSSAGTASATAITTQVGDFAACANAYSFAGQGVCPYTDAQEVFYEWWVNYKQQIKFNSSGCNAGGCNSDPTEVLVTSVYSVGRKAVTSTGFACSWGGTKYAYELGSCAC